MDLDADTLRQIVTIPRLEARFEVLVFRRRFDMHIAELKPDLAVARAAAVELRSSSRFKGVLRIVLSLGNALNGSTFRGNAGGFKLEDLLKVSIKQKDSR